ncbi:hypothetical protein K9N08_03435 [Candidatus Gracilibacteria bacterium]|nr:hypothetical protein [Candidatus Gracilibacteria bacterium]MCF7896440.1 hypothetical protein [Candidatus Gracilibacteria bacterium]
MIGFKKYSAAKKSAREKVSAPTIPVRIPPKQTNSAQNKSRFWKPEYQKFRVRSGIKTFRDLEVYQQSNQLSAEIFQFKLPPKAKNRRNLTVEIDKLQTWTKQIPRLIAESYGDKFGNLSQSLGKLETAAQLISGIIAKIDFLLASLEHSDSKELLLQWLKKYQIQRVRILNLKRAWGRIFRKGSKNYLMG